MFNPDCRLIIQLNLQPDAFALIHSLQIFSIWLFTIYNLQILCKAIWRYFGVQECRIKLWTKSVAVHMSGAVLCKKNFGQISENAVEQLQVPRNQRELRIDLCNYFSKRAMHWLIYLMQLDCDDDKYEEE